MAFISHLFRLLPPTCVASMSYKHIFPLFFLLFLFINADKTIPGSNVAIFQIQNLTINWLKSPCENQEDDCVFKLRICGGVSFRKAPSNRNCPYLYQTTDIRPSEFPINISIPIRIRWPETPWHLTMSGLRNYHDVLFESSESYDKHTALDDWQDVELISPNAIVKLSFDIQCQDFMHGPSCATYCNDQHPDPLGGHFKCSKIGDRLCAPNWSGSGCNDPICYQKCVPGQGNCTQPNVCSCHRGWKGASCEVCIPRHDCQHGYCNKPGECICHEHWTGPSCNIEVDYCKRHPGICLNGGTCSSAGVDNGHYCNCTSDYHGQNCELKKDLCSVVNCGKGLCVVEDGYPRCYCPQNTVGEFCNILENAGNLQSSFTQNSAYHFFWSHTLATLLSLLFLFLGFFCLIAVIYYFLRKKQNRNNDTIDSLESNISTRKVTDSYDADPPPSYSLLDLTAKNVGSRKTSEERTYVFPSTTV